MGRWRQIMNDLANISVLCPIHSGSFLFSASSWWSIILLLLMSVTGERWKEQKIDQACSWYGRLCPFFTSYLYYAGQKMKKKKSANTCYNTVNVSMLYPIHGDNFPFLLVFNADIVLFPLTMRCKRDTRGVKTQTMYTEYSDQHLIWMTILFH